MSNQSGGTSSASKDTSNLPMLKKEVIDSLTKIIGEKKETKEIKEKEVKPEAESSSKDPKNIASCCEIPTNDNQKKLCTQNILNQRIRFGNKDNKYFPLIVKKKFANCLLEKINDNKKLAIFIDLFKQMSKKVYDAFKLNKLINKIYDFIIKKTNAPKNRTFTLR